jgi:hypothetical protein
MVKPTYYPTGTYLSLSPNPNPTLTYLPTYIHITITPKSPNQTN